MFSQREIERILEVFVYTQNLVQKDDPKYFKYINDMKAVNLPHLTKAYINIVQGFLFVWGGMGRTGIRQAIPRTQRTIQRYADFLQSARSRKLHQVDLASDKGVIEEVFQELHALVGPVAAAKTLHLICPEFFPLWDGYILHGYDSSYKAKHGSLLISIGQIPGPTGNKRVITGTGYYNFMELTRAFIAKYRQHLCQVQSVLNAKQPQNAQKGLLKIVDEFNIHATHAPFYYLV